MGDLHVGWELGRGQKACASLIYSPGTLAVCRSTPWGVWGGLTSAENGLGHRLVLVECALPATP